MLYFSIFIALISIGQLVYYFIIQKRLEKIPYENKIDDVAKVAMKIKEDYSKKNLFITVSILIITSIFNIMSVIGGLKMEKEIKINLNQCFEQFKEEEINPVADRIEKIEDYLFPAGGDPSGGIIAAIEEQIDSLENKIIELRNDINKLAITMEQINSINNELNQLKRITGRLVSGNQKTMMSGY